MTHAQNADETWKRKKRKFRDDGLKTIVSSQAYTYIEKICTEQTF